MLIQSIRDVLPVYGSLFDQCTSKSQQSLTMGSPSRPAIGIYQVFAIVFFREKLMLCILSSTGPFAKGRSYY